MGKRFVPGVGDNVPEIGSRVWRLVDIELDERLLELRIGGVEKKIEPKPLAILMILLRNAERVVTAKELGQTVWGGRSVSEQVIAQSLTRLRRVLGTAHADLIRTVHGWGYRLTQLPEASKPPPRSGGRGKELRPGDDHPSRRGWKLVEPILVREGRGWLVEHQESGLQRIFLHLRRAVEIGGAAREISQYNGAVKGGKLDGIICYAQEWNFDTTRAVGFVEYPANLQSLPAWIHQQGGFSCIDMATRMEIVARIGERVATAHSHQICFGRLNPAATLVGPRGIDDPLIYLPSAMHRIDSLYPRLYCRQWVGHEALYVAPELRRGEPVQTASDVYSIGLLLLQMVSGDWTALPLPGWEDTIDDAGIRELVEKATQVNSAARSQSARTLSGAIRRCASALASASSTGPASASDVRRIV